MSTTTTLHTSGRHIAKFGAQAAIIGGIIAVVLAFAMGDRAHATTALDASASTAAEAHAGGTWATTPAQGNAAVDAATASHANVSSSGEANASTEAKAEGSSETSTGPADGDARTEPEGPGKRGAFANVVVSIRDLVAWVESRAAVYATANADATLDATTNATLSSSDQTTETGVTVDGDANVEVDVDGSAGLNLDGLLGISIDAGTTN